MLFSLGGQYLTMMLDIRNLENGIFLLKTANMGIFKMNLCSNNAILYQIFDIEIGNDSIFSSNTHK